MYQGNFSLFSEAERYLVICVMRISSIETRNIERELLNLLFRMFLFSALRYTLTSMILFYHEYLQNQKTFSKSRIK